jgi:hypothetical protein
LVASASAPSSSSSALLVLVAVTVVDYIVVVPSAAASTTTPATPVAVVNLEQSAGSGGANSDVELGRKLAEGRGRTSREKGGKGRESCRKY